MVTKVTWTQPPHCVLENGSFNVEWFSPQFLKDDICPATVIYSRLQKVKGDLT